MKKVEMALAQLICEDGKVENNLARLDQVVQKHGPSHDLILFPETFIMGFPAPKGFPSPEVIRSLAEPLDGPIVKHLERLAKETNISIVVGLYEKEDDNIYNTTIFVGPTGLLFSYRKTHLWGGESRGIKAGDCFRSCSWQGTKVGLLICYDIEYPETARTIASMGTELLLVTDGNWEGPLHRIAIQARAQENQMFVAMTNRLGQLGEIIYCGGSLVVDPYGQIIAEAGREEEVLSVSIDLSLVQESRQEYHYLKERKILFDSPSKQIEKGMWEIKI